jgi:large subunit ribosomal protein L24
VNIKSHVKTGDTVLVLTGKDAGKKGKVLDVLPKEGKVLVEGVNIRTIHKKPRGMNQEGGRIEQPGHIHISNVMLICQNCKQPTRIGRKYLDDGSKVRYCKKCSEIIDNISKGKKD